MPGAANQLYARIAEEASIWLEKIERALSDEEGKALRAWLKFSPHRETIVDRCKRWHGPEVLAVLGELIPVETFSDRVERQYGRIVLGIFLGVSGIGLSTVLMAFSKHLPGSDARQNPLRAEAEVSTTVGDRKMLQLPDGGSIVLNTSTHVFLDYTPRSRDITLQTGEASFDARHDSARPFRVHAGARVFEVRPGDARFNLRKLTYENVELTVVRGQVRAFESRLTAPLSPALLRERVTYGDHVFSASEGGILGGGWQSAWKLSAVQVGQRVAWQAGRTASSLFRDSGHGLRGAAEADGNAVVSVH